MFFVKMKVKIVFDRHTRDFFLGKKRQTRIRSYPKIVIIIPYAQYHSTSFPVHIWFEVVRRRNFFTTICGIFHIGRGSG